MDMVISSRREDAHRLIRHQMEVHMSCHPATDSFTVHPFGVIVRTADLEDYRCAVARPVTLAPPAPPSDDDKPKAPVKGWLQ